MIDKGKISEIEKDYKKGYTYKQIVEKYQVTYNEVTYLIKKEKWKRKSNLSKVKKGNKNAKGNKGGHAPKKNKNAVTTGEYENIFSSCFSEQEKDVFDNYKCKDKKAELMHELKILTIRESRMLNRIKALQEKDRDMIISSISKSNTQNSYKNWSNSTTTTTNTHAENTIVAIQRVEDALTRVQEAKRRCIESLNKINLDNTKMQIEKEKLNIEKKRLEINLRDLEGEELEDTSETDADIYGSN